MIIAWSLEEAWWKVCRECMAKGRTYTIERGSYAGQQRKQLDTLAIQILRPGTRPLAPIVRGVPVASDESIQRYFENYLVNPELQPNEAYTYASRIATYVVDIAQILKKTPNTNQATLEVARPEDVLLEDPPCLRVISWKAINGHLQMTTFWRSWDLYVGFPTNLGGLQLLNEMMAEWASLEPGYLIAYSDGSHIYAHNWDVFERTKTC